MERKTKVTAENGAQEIIISREFNLPLELLFKAHSEPEILERWMNTKVLKMESKPHGGWRIETSDTKGNVVMRAHGVIHEFIPNQRITRTFEMENTPFDIQLEFIEFEELTDSTSKLNMHIVFKSVALRDQLLQMPFEYGINMAHNRLEEIVTQLK